MIYYISKRNFFVRGHVSKIQLSGSQPAIRRTATTPRMSTILLANTPILQLRNSGLLHTTSPHHNGHLKRAEKTVVKGMMPSEDQVHAMRQNRSRSFITHAQVTTRSIQGTIFFCFDVIKKIILTKQNKSILT